MSAETESQTPSAMADELAVASDVASGLTSLFAPVLQAVDGSLQAAQLSQQRLREQLAGLQQELQLFETLEKTPGLDAAIVSLRESREKVRKTNAIIQGVEARVEKLQKLVEKTTLATAKKRQSNEAQHAKVATPTGSALASSAASPSLSKRVVEGGAAAEASTGATAEATTEASDAVAPAARASAAAEGEAKSS